MKLIFKKLNTLTFYYSLSLFFSIACNSTSNNQTQSVVAKINTSWLNYKTGVRAILEDNNGNIWFGSYNEGACLLQNGKLQYFTTQNGLSNNQVRNIYEDKNGIIWFECGTGLSIYRNGKMTVYAQRNYDLQNPLKISNNDLWFKSDASSGYTNNEQKSGVYQYDGKQLYYQTFDLKNKSGESTPWSLSTNFVRSKSGVIWLGAYSVLISYNGKQLKTFDNESVGLNGTTENLHIRSLFEDSKGNLWIGNNCGGGKSGIGVLKYDGKEFIHFTKQHQLKTEDTKGNSLDKVFSIGEDSLGNIWFGTNESGVWSYDGNTFKNFTQKDGLDDGIVWTIYKSRSGEMWFGGGANGILRYNGKSFERIY